MGASRPTASSFLYITYQIQFRTFVWPCPHLHSRRQRLSHISQAVSIGGSVHRLPASSPTAPGVLATVCHSLQSTVSHSYNTVVIILCRATAFPLARMLPWKHISDSIPFLVCQSMSVSPACSLHKKANLCNFYFLKMAS